MNKKGEPSPNITKINPKRLMGKKNTGQKFEENRTKRLKAIEQTKSKRIRFCVYGLPFTRKEGK